MPKVAHRLVLIRTYVRTYVASLAVSLLEREREREREWEREPKWLRIYIYIKMNVCMKEKEKAGTQSILGLSPALPKHI